MNKEEKKEIKQALEIAIKTLRSNYTPEGIQAGSGHFSDIWTRDACFASLGALALGDYDIVKKTVSTIRKHGAPLHVPLRVGQKHMILKFLGINGKGVRFTEDKANLPVLDSMPLLRLIEERLRKVYGEPTPDDMETHIINYGLPIIREGYYAGWADSLKRSGITMYTNALFAAIQGKLDTSLKTTKLITKVVLQGDDICFPVDGVVTALTFGNPSRRWASALAKIFRTTLTFSLPVAIAYGKNRNLILSKAHPLFKLVGMVDYHVDMIWTWIGNLASAAMIQGREARAGKQLLLSIARKINEYREVYEVYEKNGKPVNRLFYKSEKSFSWSAGTFIYACKIAGIF